MNNTYRLLEILEQYHNQNRTRLAYYCSMESTEVLCAIEALKEYIVTGRTRKPLHLAHAPRLVAKIKNELL